MLPSEVRTKVLDVVDGEGVRVEGKEGNALLYFLGLSQVNGRRGLMMATA